METAVTFRSILKEKEFWLLCFLGVLMFPGTLIGETFFYRDLYLHYLPQKKLLSQMILNGELPYWNPYLHGGQPFLAEINFSILYPSTLFYLVLPLFTAFNVDIVGHVIFGAMGAYCLARFTGLAPLSSAVCATVFAFCGFSLSLINLMNRMWGHPYIPWLCLLSHRFLIEKRPFWFLLSVLFGVFQIFAGAPEWTLITVVTILVWSLANTYQISVGKRIVLLALFVISVLLVSAIQLIPAFEMAAVSSRTNAGSFESFSQWSVHLERIPEIIFPNFLGKTDTLAAMDYWGWRIEDSKFPFILSIYFGFPAIFLAVGALIELRSSQLKKLYFGLSALGLIGILFCLGRYFPATYFIYEWIPGLDRFRYPAKFLCLAVLPISYLAASGFELHWNAETWQPGRGMLTVLCSITALLILLCFLLDHPAFLQQFTFLIFKVPSTDAIRSGIFGSLIHTSLVTAVISFIYILRKPESKSWFKYAVFGIIALDLIIAGKNLNPLAPVSFYEETPDAVRLVRQELAGGKLYRTPNPSGIILKAPSNDVLWQYRWNQEVLSDYLATSYRIPVIFHDDFDGLAQKRLMDLTLAIAVLPWEKRLPLLSFAGVTVIMTHEKLALPGVEPAYVLRNRSNVPFYIYRNRGAVLPAARVNNVDKVNDFSSTLNFLTSVGFSPETRGVTDEKLEKTNSCNDLTGSVRLLRTGLREMEYETSGKCSGYLLLGLPFYKGWQVSVDGKPERLIKMNWAFSGVQIPSANHRVILRYSPTSVNLGVVISLVSILVLVIFTVTMNHAAGKT